VCVCVCVCVCVVHKFQPMYVKWSLHLPPTVKPDYSDLLYVVGENRKYVAEFEVFLAVMLSV
jgi:hypothetical protein